MASATLLYIGTRDGLFVASRPGTSSEWHITRQTLAGRAVAALALSDAFPPRLLASVREVGLFHSGNGGRDWMLTLPLPVSALLADPQDPERLFAGRDARPESARAPAPAGLAAGSMVLLSADGGLTWQPGGELLATPTRICSLALTGGVRTPGGRTLWAGLESGGVVYSTDSGLHWQGLVPGPELSAPLRALVSIGPEAKELLAVTPGGIYRLVPGEPAAEGSAQPGSLVWRRTAGQAPRDISRLLALGRASLPGRTSTALLAVDGTGTLWRSDDAGASWQALALEAPAGEIPSGGEVAVLAAHPDYPDRGYAGTRAGAIYETRNRGTTWDDTGLRPGAEPLCLTVAVLK